jgi:hypothetical protein
MLCQNPSKQSNGLEGIRTPDRSVKSRLLHLAELQAQKKKNDKVFNNYFSLSIFFSIFFINESATFDRYLAGMLLVI